MILYTKREECYVDNITKDVLKLLLKRGYAYVSTKSQVYKIIMNCDVPVRFVKAPGRRYMVYIEKN